MPEINYPDILRCPSCKGLLLGHEVKGPANGKILLLECRSCKKQYSDYDGYPDFLADTGLTFSSSREKLIRSVYAKFYTPITDFMFLFCGGAAHARREVLTRLDVKEGNSILETGMGAGENLLWINERYQNLKFYAIDIQKQMMLHCAGNLRKWKISAEIYRADAEELPFKDEAFDVVFHLGAINLFRDKKKAIDEMIRVAKPGTKIVIADETEKAGKLFNVFTGAKEEIIPPTGLIPGDMTGVLMEIIWRGFGYVISFVKPAV